MADGEDRIEVPDIWYSTAEELEAAIAGQFERYLCRHGETGFDTITSIKKDRQRTTFISHDRRDAIVLNGPWNHQWDLIRKLYQTHGEDKLDD